MRTSMQKTVLTFVSLVALAIPAAAVTGCELIASVDRSLIPNDNDAATPDASTGDGGVDATPDSSGIDATPDVTTDAPGDAPTEAGCGSPADCPAPANDCQTATCNAGVCGTTNKASGTTCTSNGGKVCDGSGSCVHCVHDNDCPASGTACAAPKCTSNTCGKTNAAKGTACTDNGGVVCDGNGVCVSAHCNDGLKDADETDVDCGGASCAPCATGKTCAVGSDCVDKVCSGTPKTCQAASCTDNVQNGGETDTDCGGSTCPKCADKKHCSANTDCTNNVCFGSNPGTCVSCSDNTKDGNETDVDCGGALCDSQNKLCAVGKVCSVAADCTSGFCQNNVCALRPDGNACTADAQCANNHCANGFCCNTACTGTCQACSAALTGGANGVCGNITAGSAAPTGQCTANGTCGNTGKCAAGGACEQAPNTTQCGSASCSNGQLTTAGFCSGSGTCNAGTTSACPKGVKCASATACLSSCASDVDCQDTTNDYCSGGTCVAKGGAGAVCGANNQCVSTHCGTSGAGHCCTSASCPASVAACGATDCNVSGACAYPGNSTAPGSLQTPGDCQRVVCNGAGGTTSVDDPTDLPVSNSACLIHPACQGTPLAPHFDPAPTGTPCMSGGDPAAHVCGNTSNGLIAGTCVECNANADCTGGKTCNTSTGMCQ